MNTPSRILFIDDDEALREVFSVKLTASGFRAETAESGETGIKKAKEFKPDLILMDVKMPKMDGVEALMTLKEDPETKNIKVVFLTSVGDPRTEGEKADNSTALEAGALGFIRKTDDLDKVVAQVKSFLTQ